MFKKLLNPKKWLISLSIFGVAGSVIYAIPEIHQLDVSVHGWGWAAILGIYVGLVVVASYLKGFFCKGLFSINLNGIAAGACDEFVCIQLMALSLFISSCVLPDKVACGSAPAAFLLALILGVASCLDDYVQSIIDARTPTAKQ